MMKIINLNCLKEVIDSINFQLDELCGYQKILFDDVNLITNYYVGKDANIVVEKYNERINNITKMIDNYEKICSFLYGKIGYKSEGKINLKNKINFFKKDIIDTINSKIASNDELNDISLLGINNLEFEILKSDDGDDY